MEFSAVCIKSQNKWVGIESVLANVGLRSSMLMEMNLLFVVLVR